MVDVQEQSCTRTVEQSWFHPRREHEIFLYWESFTTVPGPTQPPIRWLPLSERPGRGAHHSDPSSADVKNEKFHPPLLPLPYATIVCTQTSNFLFPYEILQSLQVLNITVLAYLFNFSNAMSSISDLILVLP